MHNFQQGHLECAFMWTHTAAVFQIQGNRAVASSELATALVKAEHELNRSYFRCYCGPFLQLYHHMHPITCRLYAEDPTVGVRAGGLASYPQFLVHITPHILYRASWLEYELRQTNSLT